MHIILIILVVCLAGLFIWQVTKKNKPIPIPPSPYTISESIKSKAIKELSQLDSLRLLKQTHEEEYYKKLYFIVTTLSELRYLQVKKSRFEDRGWYIKAEREMLKNNDFIVSTIYYPSFGYGKGSGSEHYPLRYLKTEKEANATLCNILETRVEELVKDYKKEIEKITLWED